MSSEAKRKFVGEIHYEEYSNAVDTTELMESIDDEKYRNAINCLENL